MTYWAYRQPVHLKLSRDGRSHGSYVIRMQKYQWHGSLIRGLQTLELRLLGYCITAITIITNGFQPYMSVRFRWLKSTVDNLKLQYKQFWKYVAAYIERNSVSVWLEVGGTHLAEPYIVADAFAKHFHLAYNTPFFRSVPLPFTIL
jgi:hypothetical protein